MNEFTDDLHPSVELCTERDESSIVGTELLPNVCLANKDPTIPGSTPLLTLTYTPDEQRQLSPALQCYSDQTIPERRFLTQRAG